MAGPRTPHSITFFRDLYSTRWRHRPHVMILTLQDGTLDSLKSTFLRDESNKVLYTDGAITQEGVTSLDAWYKHMKQDGVVSIPTPHSPFPNPVSAERDVHERTPSAVFLVLMVAITGSLRCTSFQGTADVRTQRN
jgi:hypothetical protein